MQYLDRDKVDENTAARAPWYWGTGVTASPARHTHPSPASSSTGPSRQQKRKVSNLTTKGAGKGKTNCHRETKGGKPICFRFNGLLGCKDAKCAREHVCHRCILPHPATSDDCAAVR